MKPGFSLALGLVFGVVLGIAFDNLANGIALGVLFGVVGEGWVKRQDADSSSPADSPETLDRSDSSAEQ